MYKLFSIICFLNLIGLALFSFLVWFTETAGETPVAQIIQKLWITLFSSGIGIILFALALKSWNT